MTIGAFLFAQPLALLGLLALPVIWWLLRASPPEPVAAELPSLPLLDGLIPREETPDRTPWWIILLRIAITALAIIGFARPSFQPEINTTSPNGPVLIMVDDGWTSAPRWRDIQRAVIASAEGAAEDGQGVYLVFTAPRAVEQGPVEILDAATVRGRIQSAKPAPWTPDRLSALDRVASLAAPAARTIWISDGLDHGGAREFGKDLSQIGPLDVRVLAPQRPFAILNGRLTATGASVTVHRATAQSPAVANVTAQSETGASIASATATFEPDQLDAEAVFDIPAVALNRISRFRLLGPGAAGGVWLWDDSTLSPTIALADTTPGPQPLLEEMYYVRKALDPSSNLFDAPLLDAIDQEPDAIVLGDRGPLTTEELDALTAWVEAGGALIRFAGPKLAASDIELAPTPLRPAARALGGALAWDDPQSVAPFPSDSPFAGIGAPDDVLIRRQVLAQPAPDLADRTWARLADGTPLVTAASRGRGTLVLFHVTADPAWSDLPYSGAFPEMLRRAAASGDGGAQRKSRTDGAYAPVRTLDGFGVLSPPPSTVSPIDGDDMDTARASFATPPGLYSGPAGSAAINDGIDAPVAIAQWPARANVITDQPAFEKRSLGGVFLAAALALLALDMIVALMVAGRLPRLSGRAAGLSGAIVAAGFLALPDAAVAQSLAEKQRDAALNLRFAYVETGAAQHDAILRDGLRGLGLELYKRTSVEPAEPHSVVLGQDRLELYPLIYFAPQRGARALNSEESAALNAYLQTGGALVIDTRDAVPGLRPGEQLAEVLGDLDVPPLQPAPDGHVITRSFYLIDDYPGRLTSGRLWIESDAVQGEARRGDGVSSLFIGANDWISAWAVDNDYRPLFDLDGDKVQREMSYRFGINLVMYVLTGNYKEDQVHLPALLERLDEEAAMENGDRVRSVFEEPDFNARPQDLQDFFKEFRRQRSDGELPEAAE